MVLLPLCIWPVHAAPQLSSGGAVEGVCWERGVSRARKRILRHLTPNLLQVGELVAQERTHLWLNVWVITSSSTGFWASFRLDLKGEGVGWGEVQIASFIAECFPRGLIFWMLIQTKVVIPRVAGAKASGWGLAVNPLFPQPRTLSFARGLNAVWAASWEPRTLHFLYRLKTLFTYLPFWAKSLPGSEKLPPRDP